MPSSYSSSHYRRSHGRSVVPQTTVTPSMVSARITSELNRRVVGEARVPMGLKGTLKPYQVEDIAEFVQRLNGRGYLSHEMGLGKTVMAIAIAACYRECWPVLVVVPKSMLRTWERALSEWLEDELEIQAITTGTTAVSPTADFVLTTYGIVRLECNQHVLTTAGDGFYRMVIADEAHCLNGASNKGTIHMLDPCKRAERLVLLTGTPTPNGCAAELYAGMRMVVPKLSSVPVVAFGKCFANASYNGYAWDFHGISQPYRSQYASLLKALTVRRAKTDVLGELSPMQETIVWLDTNPSKMAAVYAYEAVLDAKADPAKSEIMQLFRVMVPAKIDAVVEWLKDEIMELCTSHEKLVIFAVHHAMHAALREIVSSVHIPFVQLTGESTVEQREAGFAAFRTHAKIAILSLDAFKEGITLTEASCIVFAELSFNPSVMAQAKARIHRIGQSAHTACYTLVAVDGRNRNTPDEIQLLKMQGKQSNVEWANQCMEQS